MRAPAAALDQEWPGCLALQAGGWKGFAGAVIPTSWIPGSFCENSGFPSPSWHYHPELLDSGLWEIPQVARDFRVPDFSTLPLQEWAGTSFCLDASHSGELTTPLPLADAQTPACWAHCKDPVSHLEVKLSDSDLIGNLTPKQVL